jgi:hypothetical protein
MSGGVILDSLHLPAFLTGLAVAAPFFAALGAFQQLKTHLPGILLIGVGVLVALFVSCRFALGGLAGDTLGGLLADSGWELRDVWTVFLRYVTLLLVWIVPFAGLWWVYTPRIPFLKKFVHFNLSNFPSFLALYALTVLIAPSALLTAAAAANRFRDMISPVLWRGLFSERWGEFFLVVFSALGAPVTLVILASPFLLLAYNQSQTFFMFLTGLTMIYLAGVVVGLHGRLCGFFARAIMAEPEELVPQVAPVQEAAPGLDIDAEMKSAREEYDIEPSRGIARLRPLLETEKDPRVGAALAEMCLKSGDIELALKAARHSIATSVHKGDAKSAVVVYRMIGARISEANLPATSLIAVGEVFLHEGDTAAASHALGTALIAEPRNLKAFKGLLKVADQFAAKSDSVPQGVRVYEFLIKSAPDSPFIEHAQTGLGVAKRKLEKGT